MTQYTFKPSSGMFSVNWTNPAIWRDGVVPNAADADVDFPVVTDTATGNPYITTVAIQSGERIIVRSVELRDTLQIDGNISVSGTLTQYRDGAISLYGGTLSAGALINGGGLQGSGHIVAGTFTNNAGVAGADLVIDATTFINNGDIGAAGGTVTINVGSGGFAGLQGGTLTSGQLFADRGALLLHASGPITADAASIRLADGTIASRDPTSGQDVALTASLKEITSTGTLFIDSGSYHFNSLRVDGTLALLDAANVSADHLSITAQGELHGAGSFTGDITNDGVIQAGRDYGVAQAHRGILSIDGDVTGNGFIEILSGHIGANRVDFESYGATLRLGGKSSQNVIFDDETGTFQLGQSSDFTGKITITPGGDKIILEGISVNSITNASYVVTNAGGTLTLQQSDKTFTLNFTGNHTLGNFTLSAGPQKLSSDPASLLIKAAGHGQYAGQDFNGDGRSDILWRNVDGVVSTWSATGTGDKDAFAQNTFHESVLTSWTAVESFDFNGDGRADILWQSSSNELAVWAATATGFQESTFVESSIGQWPVVGTGDYNGDGRDDVMLFSNGRINVAGSNGTDLAIGAYRGYYNTSYISPDWMIEGTSDFTGDGKSDILWRSTNGSLSTWNANGTTTAADGTNFQENSWSHAPVDRAWHVDGLADFNGDGKSDILWRNDNGSLSVWTSTGDHGFTESQFNSFAPSEWSVAQVGDVNGDGLADILWRKNDGEISIWHSTGNGWNQATYSDHSVGNDWSIVAHHFAL